jgi:hypothetical protein
LLIPSTPSVLSDEPSEAHAELGIVAAGTLAGSEPE